MFITIGRDGTLPRLVSLCTVTLLLTTYKQKLGSCPIAVRTCTLNIRVQCRYWTYVLGVNDPRIPVTAIFLLCLVVCRNTQSPPRKGITGVGGLHPI